MAADATSEAATADQPPRLFTDAPFPTDKPTNSYFSGACDGWGDVWSSPMPGIFPYAVPTASDVDAEEGGVSLLTVVPDSVRSAAADLTRIGSELNAARAAAAISTTGLVAA